MQEIRRGGFLLYSYCLTYNYVQVVVEKGIINHSHTLLGPEIAMSALALYIQVTFFSMKNIYTYMNMKASYMQSLATQECYEQNRHSYH